MKTKGWGDGSVNKAFHKNLTTWVQPANLPKWKRTNSTECPLTPCVLKYICLNTHTLIIIMIIILFEELSGHDPYRCIAAFQSPDPPTCHADQPSSTEVLRSTDVESRRFWSLGIRAEQDKAQGPKNLKQVPSASKLHFFISEAGNRATPYHQGFARGIGWNSLFKLKPSTNTQDGNYTAVTVISERILSHKTCVSKPDVMAYTCNPRTQKIEAGGSLWICSQPGINSEF